ncbi:hypothetical protein [Celeribacter neptunius]|uniref:Dihydroorotate dehydrogenase n=1 Tax=Celeribacter neptunius TaxID=588602 RepID=A0A1I3IL10_9RHOB|nr:hypothetical protein [Celeribacter neptunius]SFI48560.1 hypothetical protein SAMN04487991_0051 [Celeribacter neptunius]
MTDRDNKRMNELTDQALDALFSEARAETAMPSADLMARIMADAEAEIAASAAAERARIESLRPQPQRHPLIAAMVAALGGWRTVAGLATAGVAGLGIGLGAPAAVTSLALDGYGGSYSIGGYSAGSDGSVVLSAETRSDMTSSGYVLDAFVPSFYDLAAEG